jgi:hypothetical protein
MFVSRRRAPILIVIFLLIIIGIAVTLLLTRRTQAAVGPPIALCPGPDLYGYTCASGAGYTYIDATIDTLLYQDDGTTTLPLPFPFTFYGTTYTEVQLSSNGNLQFGHDNPTYLNECMTGGPVADMSDMIAPFWDDLDLTFYGYLEYETVGEAPNRLFVIEWDNVPPFQAEPEDAVTFEVQLFEGSNDIVFLYEDVISLERSNGRSATIGLQSEAQGISLQYGCNQPVVANTTGLYFPHPSEPNPDLGQEVVIQGETVRDIQAKGDVAELITNLERQGPTVLTQLRNHWLSQSPARLTEWRWADVVGNGRDDLILLWHSTSQHPELTQLVLLSADETGRMVVLFDQHLSSRQKAISQIAIVATADLTYDDKPDMLLHDEATNQLFVLTTARDVIELVTVPERCTGQLAVVDSNEDGRLEIARDGCPGGRVVLVWNGRTFHKQ